jgi:Zn finger protein HypA/HybF involved in hydrogenase expression
MIIASSDGSFYFALVGNSDVTGAFEIICRPVIRENRTTESRKENTMDKCSKCGTSCKAGINATYDDNSVICDQCRGVERRDVIIDGVLVQEKVAWLPGENEAVFESNGKQVTVRRSA